MSECKINHSTEDLRKKFETQMDFLPSNIKEAFPTFLESGQNQESLNAAFHLLKKYDLSSKEEKSKRDIELWKLVSNNSEK